MAYLLTLAEKAWAVCKFLQGLVFVCKKEKKVFMNVFNNFAKDLTVLLVASFVSKAN